jgi:hypothetical protein
VTFDHNVLRNDLGGILLQNATDSAILDNEFIDTRGNSIVIGGGTQRLVLSGNRPRGARLAGIRFIATFIDRFPIPNHDVAVTHNDLSGGGSGIIANTNTLADSLISENTTSENGGNGILFGSGPSNVVRGNESNNNGVAGITAALGGTGNVFEQNSMHGNGSLSGTGAPGADARDLNPLVNGVLQNVWTGNDCDTDIPAGMICGVG